MKIKHDFSAIGGGDILASLPGVDDLPEKVSEKVLILANVFPEESKKIVYRSLKRRIRYFESS